MYVGTTKTEERKETLDFGQYSEVAQLYPPGGIRILARLRFRGV